MTTNTKAAPKTRKAATKATKATKAPVAAPVAAAAPAPTYTLNAAAQTLAGMETANATLQAPTKGLGVGWRQAGYTAPNTRAGALACVACLPQPFTFAAAKAALQAAVKGGTLKLGSGTPQSYCKAFVANGYFEPSA